jgi:hypothetical protein
MRKGIFVLAAAAASLVTLPAMAGELGSVRSTDMTSQVRVDGPGVGVRIGPDRDRWRHRHWREREVRGDCRSVTVRETRPDGSRVTRTRTRC